VAQRRLSTRRVTSLVGSASGRTGSPGMLGTAHEGLPRRVETDHPRESYGWVACVVQRRVPLAVVVTPSSVSTMTARDRVAPAGMATVAI